MDTTKDAEPDKTPARGETTVAEQTSAAAGNPTSSGNLKEDQEQRRTALEAHTAMCQMIQPHPRVLGQESEGESYQTQNIANT